MILGAMTDAEQASLIRRIAALFGLNSCGTSERELMDAIRGTRERAEKYDDLCR